MNSRKATPSLKGWFKKEEEKEAGEVDENNLEAEIMVYIPLIP